MRDDAGGVLTFDGVDESAVHEAQLQVRPAVPHRERRSLDELRERIERTFRLFEAKRDARTVLLRYARVEKP